MLTKLMKLFPGQPRDNELPGSQGPKTGRDVVDEADYRLVLSGKPRVIAIVNGKGGVGKTAMAINLAAVAASCQMSSLIIDTDVRQQSADEWKRAGGTIPVVVHEPSDVAEAMQRYVDIDVIVVDTCGADLAAHSKTVEIADLVLVPMSTSRRDSAPALRAYRRAVALDRPARIVWSLVEPSASEGRLEEGTTRTEEALKRLSISHPDKIAKTVIRRRIPVRDAMDVGGTALTGQKTEKSAKEFESLWREVVAILNGSIDEVAA